MVSRNADYGNDSQDELVALLAISVVALILAGLFWWLTSWLIQPRMAEAYSEIGGLQMPSMEEIIAKRMEEQAHSNYRVMRVVDFINYANPKLDSAAALETARSIVKWSTKYKLPLGLVVGVCHVESNFKANAIGPKTKYGKALGMMQVMWPVHSGLAGGMGLDRDGLLTIDGGIHVGCSLLRSYIRDERGIIGGLKRYFSQSSRQYILEKVMTTYLTFDQHLADGITSYGNIKDVHASEVRNMRKLTRGR